MEPQPVTPARSAAPGPAAVGDEGIESGASSVATVTSKTTVAALLSCLPLSSDVDIDPVLAALIEEVTRVLQTGRRLEIEDLAVRDPAHAEMVRRLVPSLRRLAGLGPEKEGGRAAVEPAHSDPSGGGRRLGDFRL